MSNFKLKKLSHVDPWLLISTFGLLGLGTIMVFSASSLVGADRFGDSAYYLKHHLASAFLGLVCMLVLFFMNIRGLRKLSLPLLGIICVALAATALTKVGISAKHATRWISIAGFHFQPSEFAKPIIILYVAAYLSKKGDQIHDFLKGLLPLLLTLGMILLLILKQPDFGTCIAIAATTFMMLFVGRAKLLHLGGLSLLLLLAGYTLMMAASYRRARLMTFLNPWHDPQGSGFQILQSFVAFQRGGLSGQGLGDGSQKLLYLPEAHTDFIFSVIAEELGFAGAIAVIVLFSILIIRGIQLALKIREPFASQLAFGLTVMVGIQAIFNMAVVMGLVPTKGLTLPLVSYGGSSLMSTMASIGVLFSLSATMSVSSNMARKVEK